MNTHEELEFTVGYVFCGLGAVARGFAESMGRLGAQRARFRSVGGVDIDAEACADFEMLTGSKATRADVAKMTPAELRAAWGDHAPWAIFTSPPCKGFSRLLGAKAAKAAKYQALNELVFQGLFLVCETWSKPPPLIVLENVPGITQRGAELLAKVRQLLTRYGYVFHTATHDCGEIGGLAQHRRRFLLVARRPEVVPGYIYRPPKQRVRGCGEVLGELPMPGDPAAGALHQLPRISWLNWVRLSMIPPGGDWRDLPGSQPKDPEARRRWEQEGVKTPGEVHLFKGKKAMMPWDRPSRTVIGGPDNGASYVAQPLALGAENPGRHEAKLRVESWADPAHAVTGATRPNSGGPSVADPRIALGQTADGAGSFKGRPGLLGVLDWEEPAPAVVGHTKVSGGNARAAVAEPFGHVNRVTGWDSPVGTITHAPAPSSGSPAVADPRLLARAISDPTRGGALGVLRWDRPAPTITGQVRAGQSNTPGSVADPRFRGSLGVTAWDEPSPTIRGESYPSNGAGAVADPRLRSPVQEGQARREVIGRYRLLDWRETSPTVTGGGTNGVYGVADPRAEDLALGCTPRAGTYGVLSWEQAAATITGTARVDNGAFAVADPRPGEPGWEPPEGVIPVIISQWNCWHRPVTTLELAVLQELPAVVDGKPLQLAGRSIARWRERIGNAVPVGAARAIGDTLLTALLAAKLGWFMSPGGDIWVSPDGRTEDELAAELGEAGSSC